MVKIEVPSEKTKEQIRKLLPELSKDNLEICGIRKGNKYLVLGVGRESCMFTIPDDEYQKIIENVAKNGSENLVLFHTHPDNEPPSELDIETITGFCDSKMEIISSDEEYEIIHKCKLY